MVALVRFLWGFAIGGGFGLAWVVAILMWLWTLPGDASSWVLVAGAVLAPGAIGGVVSLVRGWRADRRPLVGHEVGAGRPREGGLSLMDFLPFD
jgi:hypothetical protein